MGMASSASERVSAIASENTSRSRYKTSVHEESIIMLTKTPLLFTVSIKIECLALWFSHVRKAGSQVTLNTYYTEYIACWTLSSPPALSTLGHSALHVHWLALIC